MKITRKGVKKSLFRLQSFYSRRHFLLIFLRWLDSEGKWWKWKGVGELWFGLRWEALRIIGNYDWVGCLSKWNWEGDCRRVGWRGRWNHVRQLWSIVDVGEARGSLVSSSPPWELVDKMGDCGAATRAFVYLRGGARLTVIAALRGINCVFSRV